MVVADAENKLVEITAICNCTNGKKAQILSERCKQWRIRHGNAPGAHRWNYAAQVFLSATMIH
ncbi:hypothetical protein E4O93_02915 [Diaphorobacter sp. DS2]|nr:hypothetical protein E4O93_02915 [Diaphorobacter sp. DS2]